MSKAQIELDELRTIVKAATRKLFKDPVVEEIYGPLIETIEESIEWKKDSECRCVFFESDTVIQNIQAAFDCNEKVAERIADYTNNLLDAKMQDDDFYYEKALCRLSGYMLGVKESLGFGVFANCNMHYWIQLVEDRDTDVKKLKEILSGLADAAREKKGKIKQSDEEDILHPIFEKYVNCMVWKCPVCKTLYEGTKYCGECGRRLGFSGKSKNDT